MQKLGEWMKGRGLVVAGLAMATACAAQDAAEEADQVPLAEVALEDGSLVKFFEPNPGAIMIVQDGPKNAADVTNTGLSAVGLYERLAPGEGIPVALVEAQARVEIARAGRPPRTGEKSGTSSLANNTTFENAYCSGSWDIIHCRLDRTSGFWAQYNSTDYAICTVSSDAGTVTLRLLVEGDLEWSHDILAGHTQSVAYDSGTWNDQVRCEVTNVDPGNRYDLGFRFNIN